MWMETDAPFVALVKYKIQRVARELSERKNSIVYSSNVHKKALNNLVQFQLLLLFHTYTWIHMKARGRHKRKIIKWLGKEPHIIFYALNLR